ncbi:MAG: succinylglutamate-semialdehyde dehydrogenase [Phycisphaerales bacterium]
MNASTTLEEKGVIRGCDRIAGDPVMIEGDAITSHNPAHPDEVVWSGSPSVSHVDPAVRAARAALPAWRDTPIEQRIEALRAYQALANEHVDAIGELICRETGKAQWDSAGEAKLLGGKVDITLAEGPNSGRSRVTGFDLEVSETRTGRCTFRPHGVMAVIGPFNFPAHLPNGHIVPALLTGNTVVFKPSDKTPAVGQLLAELFDEALASVGAPKGVINLVQGGADVAQALTTHEHIDGILFTGSWPVGRRILEANLDHPGRIVALELGGNNPSIVMDDADLRQAAIENVRAAFVTTGQRCTCTRRLIVHEAVAEKLVPLIQKTASNLIVGDPKGIGGGSRNQAVFMGPIIRATVRDEVLAGQQAMIEAGATPLLEATAMDHPSGGHYITPGLLRVDAFTTGREPKDDPGCDTEFFGPLLRMTVVSSLDEAIEQANATRYGLAASVFTKDQRTAGRVLREVRAGCVNVNTGTAGASGKLPFGGLGWSGNHRPAGAFSLDYTAYPVASLLEKGDAAGVLPGMRFDDDWLS